jgi:hypothetical protein
MSSDGRASVPAVTATVGSGGAACRAFGAQQSDLIEADCSASARSFTELSVPPGKVLWAPDRVLAALGTAAVILIAVVSAGAEHRHYSDVTIARTLIATGILSTFDTILAIGLL